MAEMVTVQVDDLRDLVIRRLAETGLAQEDAAVVADVLVYAEMRGIHSHGVMRVEHYCNRITAGGMNLTPALIVQELKPSVARIDAEGGVGHVVAKKAMATAISLAKKHGVGLVGVSNTSHCGALAYYIEMALEQKMAGLVVGNTDAGVVPFGAKKPFFGTNPFAFGFPGRADSMLLDMATSEVAFGKIFYARENNTPIPATWAVDKEGNPTTNPHEAASLFPFGGPKGYGINMLVELLSGVMVGGVFGPHLISMYGDIKTMRNLSSFFLVFNPTAFLGEAVFDTAQAMFDEVHGLEPATGVERVLLPGEIERLATVRARVAGVAIPAHIHAYLSRTA